MRGAACNVKSTRSFGATLALPTDSELAAREKYARRRRRQENDGTADNGPVATAIRLFRRDRDAPVTLRDRERCVSICAWSFALCIMFVSIGFLFADFFKSRRNPALTTRLVDAPHLDLPIVTFCLAVPSLPASRLFRARAITAPRCSAPGCSGTDSLVKRCAGREHT